MDIKKLIRPNILKLAPYSTARDEYKGGNLEIFLDANESPYGAPLNRYPDPRLESIRKELSAIKNVSPSQIFAGNGSDEAIDLIYRIFCIPSKSNAVMIAPSYGMYKVAADINDIEVRDVLLNGEDFSLSTDKLFSKIDENTRVIFLCSPNNPSGNLLNRDEVLKIVKTANAIVVVDEAYVDFCSDYYESFVSELNNYPNLIVLQTLSKAWGMAGVRFGMAFASQEIISIMNKVKYPYNINVLTQKAVENALKNKDNIRATLMLNSSQRDDLNKKLATLPYVQKIYKSDANFILVKVDNADDLYNFLMEKGVIVRNRSSVILCENCLRITIGTMEENKKLKKLLEEYAEKNIIHR